MSVLRSTCRVLITEERNNKTEDNLKETTVVANSHHVYSIKEDLDFKIQKKLLLRLENCLHEGKRKANKFKLKELRSLNIGDIFLIRQWNTFAIKYILSP